MINDLIQYSAVTAKARAMYGRRMTDGDWTELAQARTARDIWEFLSRRGGWQAASEAACASDADRLSEAVGRQPALDCERLCLYLKKRDPETLRFYVKRPDGLSPEEVKRWWSEGGAKHAGLRRVAGAEADALNLVYILRLRRFPASVPSAEELLIPVRYKLKPELIRALLRAPDDRAVLELLRKTPWGGVFTSLEPGALEKQYDAYLQAFCCRVLASARPSLVTAQAYLTLKGMECARLRRFIGAVRRGIDPNIVF